MKFEPSCSFDAQKAGFSKMGAQILSQSRSLGAEKLTEAEVQSNLFDMTATIPIFRLSTLAAFETPDNAEVTGSRVLCNYSYDQVGLSFSSYFPWHMNWSKVIDWSIPNQNVHESSNLGFFCEENGKRNSLAPTGVFHENFVSSCLNGPRPLYQ